MRWVGKVYGKKRKKTKLDLLKRKDVFPSALWPED